MLTASPDRADRHPIHKRCPHLQQLGADQPVHLASRGISGAVNARNACSSVTVSRRAHATRPVLAAASSPTRSTRMPRTTSAPSPPSSTVAPSGHEAARSPPLGVRTTTLSPPAWTSASTESSREQLPAHRSPPRGPPPRHLVSRWLDTSTAPPSSRTAGGIRGATPRPPIQPVRRLIEHQHPRAEQRRREREPLFHPSEYSPTFTRANAACPCVEHRSTRSVGARPPRTRSAVRPRCAHEPLLSAPRRRHDARAPVGRQHPRAALAREPAPSHRVVLPRRSRNPVTLPATSQPSRHGHPERLVSPRTSMRAPAPGVDDIVAEPSEHPRYAASMPLLRIESLPDDLVAPVLVVAFDGWVDAAGASSAATEHLAADGALVATFDDDTLFDYRSRRPTLDIIDGTLRKLIWPAITIHRRSHRRTRHPRAARPRARLPVAGAGRRAERVLPAGRRDAVGQPRRDPRRRPAYPPGPGARDRLARRPAP